MKLLVLTMPVVQGLVAAILVNILVTVLLVNIFVCQFWSLDKRAD